MVGEGKDNPMCISRGVVVQSLAGADMACAAAEANLELHKMTSHTSDHDRHSCLLRHGHLMSGDAQGRLQGPSTCARQFEALYCKYFASSRAGSRLSAAPIQSAVLKICRPCAPAMCGVQAGVQSGAVASAVVGGMNVVGTIVAASAMDKAGRKQLLRLSFGGMGLSMLAMVAGLSLSSLAHLRGSIALFGTLAYVLTFSLGAGPVPGLLVPEITPARLRGRT